MCAVKCVRLACSLLPLSNASHSLPFCYGGDMGGYIGPRPPSRGPTPHPPLCLWRWNVLATYRFVIIVPDLFLQLLYSHSYSRGTSNFERFHLGLAESLCVWSVCGPCSRARFCRVRACLWLRCRARRVQLCSGTIRTGRAESSVSSCSNMSCAACSERARPPGCCPCCAAASRVRRCFTCATG